MISNDRWLFIVAVLLLNWLSKLIFCETKNGNGWLLVETLQKAFSWRETVNVMKMHNHF